MVSAYKPGDDSIDFFDSDLGPAIKIAVTDTVSLSTQLQPGRHLLILRAPAATWVWLKSRPFSAAAGTATADVPATPLSADGIISREYNVRAGVNDQLEVIAETGQTGTLYVERISRVTETT